MTTVNHLALITLEVARAAPIAGLREPANGECTITLSRTLAGKIAEDDFIVGG